MDRGFFLTLQAMRRQLAAMPCDYDQIRLIHAGSRQPVFWVSPSLRDQGRPSRCAP